MNRIELGPVPSGADDEGVHVEVFLGPEGVMFAIDREQIRDYRRIVLTHQRGGTTHITVYGVHDPRWSGPSDQEVTLILDLNEK